MAKYKKVTPHLLITDSKGEKGTPILNSTRIIKNGIKLDYWNKNTSTRDILIDLSGFYTIFENNAYVEAVDSKGTKHTLKIGSFIKEFTVQVREYVSSGRYNTYTDTVSLSQAKSGMFQYSPSGGEDVTKLIIAVKPVSKEYTDTNDKTQSFVSTGTGATQFHFTKISSAYQIEQHNVFTYERKSTEVPDTPDTPTVEIKDYTLNAYVYYTDTSVHKATQINFYLYKDNSNGYIEKHEVTTHGSGGYYSTSFSIEPGHEYKVRCCAYAVNSIDHEVTSELSGMTENGETKPNSVGSAPSVSAKSSTSILVTWNAVDATEYYNVRYSTNLTNLQAGLSDGSDSNIKTTSYIKTGLTTGETYYFQVQAVNDSGESDWSDISTGCTIGVKPAAPTTWSSTTTAVIGKELSLYWVHNSKDNSSQVSAELEISVNGSTHTQTIQNSTDEFEKDKTSVYSLNTSSYSEDATILWRVRTCGITGEYGDWSVQRTIKLYTQPSLVLYLSNIKKWYWNPFNFNTDTIYTADGDLGDTFDVLTEYPIYIKAIAYPSTQIPVSYYVTVISNDTYTTVDDEGNNITITSGHTMFAKNYDIKTALNASISANDIDLEDGQSYTLTVTAALNSGLTASASRIFSVDFNMTEFYPDMEVNYDPTTYTATIKPFCYDADGELVNSVTLSVFRREMDGTFTELGSEIRNNETIIVTDPHPSLDYLRYRVLARSIQNGSVAYIDNGSYYVGEDAIILQWNEVWSNFIQGTAGDVFKPAWSGSLLRLRGNVDVTDNFGNDSSIIEYIGRSKPVSYYGTMQTLSSTWKTDVPKSDKETLYGIRRLAQWLGDVYVREPSGSGYWANVTVSYSLTHSNVVVPVTFTVTRVDGGA